MSLRNKIRENQTPELDIKSDPSYMKKLQEREYRMQLNFEKWKRIPEIGPELMKMKESVALNTALALEQQTRYMKRLTETQISDGFFGAAPDHLLRLVMFSYPNSIRPELFTEFQMETAKDSIKYIRAYYNNVGSGIIGGGNTPRAINRSFRGADWYNTPMVEAPEDRIPSEMAQLEGVVTATTATFTLPSTGDNEWKHGYLDGWSSLHNAAGEPLAIQRRDGSWTIIDTAHIASITGNLAGDGVVVTAVTGVDWTTTEGAVLAPKYLVGRYDSELDLAGEHMGDVKLRMTSYQFQPRPLTMGVSWTHLSELILGSSFNASTEELMYQAVGEEIRKSLDLRAVGLARRESLTSDASFLTWDARPFAIQAGDVASVYHDTYIQHAQLITHAFERIGDLMYNKIMRGGVSRIVGGPAAVSYLSLHDKWSSAGAQPRIGAYKAGTINDIPVFKVPSSIVPDDELITIWKNDYNPADVAMAFAVLIPFFSTGTLQRKTLVKEGAVAYYGDEQVLQPKYFGRLKIKNLLQLYPSNLG
jgi:hypothetical protein